MPHLVDVHIGQRIKQRRLKVGMSQMNLAVATGVRYQQVQKYETGANRVSASRLWELGNALGVKITYFFDGISPETGDGSQHEYLDNLFSKEASDLVEAYYRTPKAQRKKLLEFVRLLAREHSQTPLD